MTRLEQIEFDTIEKLKAAIDSIIAGEEAFRTYEKDGEQQKKKIISNHKLYLGNYSIRISKGSNNKIYLSIDYFSFDDRMAIYSKKVEETDLTEV